MVKMNGCAAIDIARPFRFLADKAAVAADFHLENDACYHGKRRIASTASVCTLAKSGVVRPGFPCRIASKSGEYHTGACHSGKQCTAVPTSHYLPTAKRTWQAMLGLYTRAILLGKSPKPLNDFREIGYAPTELNINLSSENESGIFGFTAFRQIRF